MKVKKSVYQIDHPYSINSGYLLFFESTITGNTADLATVQKTIIDTLHKESKTQRVITERGLFTECCIKAYSMQSWLEGRNWVGKCAQATEMTASLRIQSIKADSNTWEIFTRSELKLESVHQESPRSDIFRKRATKPLLKQKHRQKHLTWAKEKKNRTVAQWSKVLFSNESTFCISFVNQGPRVWRKRGEAQNPCCLKSSVKFPQSVMVWAAVTSAGVGPLCFLKSTVNTDIYQEILEHFMLPSADKLYGDAEFIFQQDLAPAHTAKGPKAGSMTMCYCAWLASKLTWPEPLDERHQTQQCRWPEGRYQSNLGFITPEQCHRQIDSMPRRIDAVIHAKGAQQSIECIEMNILFRSLAFLFKINFFIDLM